MTKFNKLKISNIEMGHQFLTLYGAPHGELLRLGREITPKLPSSIRGLQRKSQVHIKDDPLIFHPYGDPEELNYDTPKHFHIIYDRGLSGSDVDAIRGLLEKMGVPDAPNIPLTDLSDNILEGVDTHKALKQSEELLELWLELRTETITELL